MFYCRTFIQRCTILLWMVIGLSPVFGQEQEVAATPADINLALRRMADKLLRASGDSTSRIPSVEALEGNTWRVQFPKDFAYDTLPALLQASLDRYEIKQAYQVAVRRCEDEVIDLGFHQKDFLQDSVVPCQSRELPECCYYIDVTFLGEARVGISLAGKSSIALLLIGLLAGGWWWYRKNKMSTLPNTKDRASGTNDDWLAFGHSRLHSNRHIVESAGVLHQLTYREAKLLRLFASHPGEVLERDIILQQVWADEGVQVGRSIDMFVSRLRKKLKADTSIGIVAVHGLGYRLEVMAEEGRA